MSESVGEITPSPDVTYTLARFADEVRAMLIPGGIEMRLIESEDGTRTIQAWSVTAPDAVATFPIDDIRISPYRAHIVGTAIRRSFRNRPAEADA